MKLDISSVTLGDKRIFSYMSQAMGLMADLDVGALVLSCSAFLSGRNPVRATSRY